ncbi:hypothetical protein B0H16DRAFT_1455455 [Mycena metata]|uniref:Uncharacterized protein n=1 Tax=Mycena metata TaxID=1033252 RepID=A0AAD7NI27_9AGAR|nr:hypothetical protein B0H16DRAFT_1455455 [Mycena metata]
MARRARGKGGRTGRGPRFECLPEREVDGGDGDPGEEGANSGEVDEREQQKREMGMVMDGLDWPSEGDTFAPDGGEECKAGESEGLVLGNNIKLAAKERKKVCDVQERGDRNAAFRQQGKGMRGVEAAVCGRKDGGEEDGGAEAGALEDDRRTKRFINRDGVNLTMLGGIMRGMQYDVRAMEALELHSSDVIVQKRVVATGDDTDVNLSRGSLKNPATGTIPNPSKRASQLAAETSLFTMMPLAPSQTNHTTVDSSWCNGLEANIQPTGSSSCPTTDTGLSAQSDTTSDGAAGYPLDPTIYHTTMSGLQDSAGTYLRITGQSDGIHPPSSHVFRRNNM